MRQGASILVNKIQSMSLYEKIITLKAAVIESNFYHNHALLEFIIRTA